jgi:3-deoxy-D-manno-octulosonic-acid transferase
MGERLGVAGLPRPQGKLVWIHAASVGEANSVIPLLETLRARAPSVRLLMTTITVTSAALMKGYEEIGFIHQFAPVDMPQAVGRFLDHWKPDVALWVDSELWPNMIIQACKRGTVLGMINARISQRSFRRWKIVSSFSQQMLSCFSFCFAKSNEDAERLKELGIARIDYTDNLKYDAKSLDFNEEILTKLRDKIGNRPVWLAASTHPGEEELVAKVHRAVAATLPDVLTIIVPRHAVRGDAIAKSLSPLSTAQRSKGEAIEPGTQIYLADTMGELGLFYRLAPIAFIGKSLSAHGGQNPLEAAKLGCAVIMGPHMENFTAIASEMLNTKAAMQVSDAESLATALMALLSDDNLRQALAGNALAHMQNHGGVVKHIMNRLQPYLA